MPVAPEALPTDVVEVLHQGLGRGALGRLHGDGVELAGDGQQLLGHRGLEAGDAGTGEAVGLTEGDDRRRRCTRAAPPG